MGGRAVDMDPKEELLVMQRVLRLTEFYPKKQLHRFFHKCERAGHDVAEAFRFLDRETLAAASESDRAPSWHAISSRYWQKHESDRENSAPVKD